MAANELDEFLPFLGHVQFDLPYTSGEFCYARDLQRFLRPLPRLLTACQERLSAAADGARAPQG